MGILLSACSGAEAGANDRLSPLNEGTRVSVAPSATTTSTTTTTTTTVPTPTTVGPQAVHVVAAGDNVYNISKQYGVSMEAIAEFNGWDTYRQLLRVGDEILIPPSGND